MSDILFIKTSSLGDVIHHMPAVSEARRHFPDAHISWAVEEPFAPLAALHTKVDEIIAMPVRRWRRNILSGTAWRDLRAAVRTLRAREYEWVIDTQGLFRTGAISKFARGHRHGYHSDSVRERGAAMFYDRYHSVPRDMHAIARNRALTGLALGYEPEGPPDFGLDRASLAGVVRTPYAVLLHATAQRSKEWPEEHWVALAQKLEQRIDLLLPFGSAKERERSERLAARLKRTRVPIHRPLDDMARLIAGASFVVGVDTGILHLAAALGVPLVAIFCGSEPKLTGPMGQGPMEIVGTRGVKPAVDDILVAIEKVVPLEATPLPVPPPQGQGNRR